jgi:hypothetical protein
MKGVSELHNPGLKAREGITGVEETGGVKKERVVEYIVKEESNSAAAGNNDATIGVIKNKIHLLTKWMFSLSSRQYRFIICRV